MTRRLEWDRRLPLLLEGEGSTERNWGEEQLRGSHREELGYHSLETCPFKLKPFCHLHQGHCIVSPTPESGSLAPEKGMTSRHLPMCHREHRSHGLKIMSPWTSLVVEVENPPANAGGLGLICDPGRSTCQGATKPMRHSYRNPHGPRACALQREKPLQ